MRGREAGATRDDGPRANDHGEPVDGCLAGTLARRRRHVADPVRRRRRYSVTVTDLDGPKTYSGTAAGNRIEFARAGRTESIRAATGQETGMKWLADETNCLVITAGSEGYCRKAGDGR
jgi:hypothetical protein